MLLNLGIFSVFFLGLEHLHHGLTKPVVHGDIKSPNILIFTSHDDRKTAKVEIREILSLFFRITIDFFSFFIQIADFGLSEELEVTAEGGDEKYSCLWAAPETIKATHKSTKSDVWSYGAALWEIWMEKLPFSFLDCHMKEAESRIILGVGSGNLVNHY